MIHDPTVVEEAHSLMVRRLTKTGNEILGMQTGLICDMNHMALGIAGEAGEIVDCIKKHTIYGKPLDLENLKEELGDMEFYLSHLRDMFGFTRKEILEGNLAKLNKRYKGGYSDKAAEERLDKTQ